MCECCNIERGERVVLAEWDPTFEDENIDGIVTTLFVERDKNDTYRMIFGTFDGTGCPIVEGDYEIYYCPFCGSKLHDKPTRYPWSSNTTEEGT